MPGEVERYPFWRRNGRIIAAGNLLTNLGFSAAFAFLPLVVKGMNSGEDLERWVGLIAFGYFFISCLFAPVWGVLADHFGRKSMVVRAGLGMGVSFLLTSTVDRPIFLLLMMMLAGLANGYVPAGLALIATNTPRSKAGSALAFSQSAAWMGNMLGPMTGAVLIGMLSESRHLFMLAGLTTLTAGLLAFYWAREEPVGRVGPLRFNLRADISRLSKVPFLKVLYCMNLTFAFNVFGANAVVSLLALRLVEATPNYGTQGVAFWIAAPAVGFTVASVVALPVWGRLLNKHDPARLLKWQLAGGFATSVFLPLVRTPLELTVGRVLFGIFIAGMTPTLVRMVRECAPTGMDGRALSYSTAIQQFGSAVAPLLAGVIAPLLGLRAFFVLASLLLLAALLLWAQMARGFNDMASPSNR